MDLDITNEIVNYNYYISIYINYLQELNNENIQFILSLYKQKIDVTKIFIFFSKSDIIDINNDFNILINDSCITNKIIFKQINNYKDQFDIILNDINLIYHLSSRIIFYYNNNLPSCKLSNDITEFFELCYQLYNSDGIIEYLSPITNLLYLDNCHTNLNFISNNFFSFQGLLIKQLINFINTDLTNNDLTNNNLTNNDLTNNNLTNNDLIKIKLLFTEWCKNNCLYICGINRSFIPNLTQPNSTQQNQKITYNPNFIIKKYISLRNLLYNVDNITYNPIKNDYTYKQIDIKYYNKKTIIVTISNFDKNLNNDIYNIIKLLINDKEYEFKLLLPHEALKYSYIIDLAENITCNKIEHQICDYKILQTSKTNLMVRSKFYSIQTILNYIPNLNYIFFSDDDIDKFMLLFNKITSTVYYMLKPGAFKADYFRALYIYNYGGIYLDCKMTLHAPLSNYLYNYNIFTSEDTKPSYSYNAFFYIKNPYNDELGKYLKRSIINILSKYYGKTSFSITGPKIFGKYIIENSFFKHTNMPDHNIRNNYVIDKQSNNIILKTSYVYYYEENNYIYTNYYYNMWINKNVYDDNYYTEEIIKLVTDTTTDTNTNTDTDTNTNIDTICNFFKYVILIKTNKNELEIEKYLLYFSLNSITYIIIDGYNESTYIIGKHLQYKFGKMNNSEIIFMLNNLNAISKVINFSNNCSHVLIINDELSYDEFLFLIKNNNIKITKWIEETKRIEETNNPDIILFEQFEQFEQIDRVETVNEIKKNTFFKLNELKQLNELNNISCKMYLYSTSIHLQNKLNNIVSESNNINQIYFYNKNIINFESTILTIFNTYIYGNKELLLTKKQGKKEKKNIFKPTINNIIINQKLITDTMLKLF